MPTWGNNFWYIGRVCLARFTRSQFTCPGREGESFGSVQYLSITVYTGTWSYSQKVYYLVPIWEH